MKLMKVFKGITDWAGNVAGASLFVMTICIFYGVVARLFSFQDYLTYGISLYALIWFSMLSVGLNARISKHVTAGISVENYVKTRFPIFPFIRSLLVIVMMLIILWGGLDQAYSSFTSHEVTTGIAQMPVWISLIAIPIGALAWIIGELCRLVEMVVSPK